MMGAEIVTMRRRSEERKRSRIPSQWRALPAFMIVFAIQWFGRVVLADVEVKRSDCNRSEACHGVPTHTYLQSLDRRTRDTHRWSHMTLQSHSRLPTCLCHAQAMRRVCTLCQTKPIRIPGVQKALSCASRLGYPSKHLVSDDWHSFCKTEAIDWSGNIWIALAISYKIADHVR
jgi:hypothetical protein